MTDLFLNGLWADRYLMAGGLAASLSIAAFAPYVRDILAGHTKPDRACWLIWAVLASLSGVSNVMEGAGTSMMFVGAQVAGTVLVCALAVRYGSGRMVSRSNIWVLIAAGLGIGSWLVTDTAAFALALSIGVSALGGARTVYKAYVAPRTETGSAWGLLLASAVCGVYSVGAADVLLLAYPVYLMALYSAVLTARITGLHAADEAALEAAHAARRARVPPLSATAAPVLARRSRARSPQAGHIAA